ncbi:hypothetical protein KBC54_00665 [Patescibacteria group bacterium]|nr:hypothetical protein [Patescibacteria group bacterium]
MAWLFIDASEPRLFRVGSFNTRSVKVHETAGRSHGVLIEAMRWLKKIGPESLDGVCVVSGPGSFTSIRTGVIVGTLIAKLRRVSLISVSCEQATDLERLRTACLSGAYAPVQYALPEYDTEPNITIARTPTN